tara:strand:- start:197 stop:475 length:279 start_codon:yes stop_codon:yes gene_type:complete
MHPSKYFTDYEIKRNICKSICKKANMLSGWQLLNTRTGSEDQDICRISLRHASFLFIPKAWSICKEVWLHGSGSKTFPVTIEEAVVFMKETS